MCILEVIYGESCPIRRGVHFGGFPLRLREESCLLSDRGAVNLGKTQIRESTPGRFLFTGSVQLGSAFFSGCVHIRKEVRKYRSVCFLKERCLLNVVESW